jgi:hypothetical protein
MLMVLVVSTESLGRGNNNPFEVHAETPPGTNATLDSLPR